MLKHLENNMVQKIKMYKLVKGAHDLQPTATSKNMLLQVEDDLKEAYGILRDVYTRG